MPVIVTKPVEALRFDPTNPRKDFPEGDQILLGSSLKKKQLVPLIIRKNGMVVDGERRLRAAMMVGLEQLDCILIEDTATEAEVKEIQLVTAMQRADLKAYEVYCGFQDYLKARPGATAKELAAAIDRSEAAVSMTLSLTRCIPAVQEAAAAGKIGVKEWYKLSKLSPEQQAAKLNGQTGEEEMIRVTRIKCPVPGKDAVVTVAGKDISLAKAIEIVQEWLKLAKRAADEGLSAVSFERVCKDKAKSS